jgi:hypothetical protein
MPKIQTNRQKKPQELQVSFYKTDQVFIEQIYNSDQMPETQFAIFNNLTGEVTYSEQYKLETGTLLKPLNIRIVREKRIFLPSEASLYNTEKNLLDSIERFVTRYLDLPHAFHIKLVSHYILLTWIYDKFSVIPYLRAQGDFGSGKTRFAQVVGALCYKPLFLAGATSNSFIYRMIELFKGTMIFNELERVNTDLSSEIVIILNNGYEKGLFVGKVEGDKKKEPVTFDVFSPKIITSRDGFKDLALESRIINIPMRTTKRKDIPTLLDNYFWEQAGILRNFLLMYRFKHLNIKGISINESELMQFNPRLRQTLIPLLYTIKNEEIKKDFINFAVEYQDQLDTEINSGIDSLIAEKIIELLNKLQIVTVKDVTENINKELDEKEKLSSKAVGKKIRGFGFKTKKVQGVFRITYSKTTVEYLVDKYKLSSISPESLQSHPEASTSEVDLVDKVDLKN